MARSRLLVSAMVPYWQKLAGYSFHVALTLDLTICSLHRGTKLLACLSNKRNPEYSRMDVTCEHMMQQASEVRDYSL